jgi:hypothetical protein
MRALVTATIICVGVAGTGVATGAPQADARAKYQVAAQLDERGEYEKALVSIEEGLAIAPRDLPLLGLKGAVLLKVRNYAGALAAYQAFLDAGASGANRREAQKIVNNLRSVQSTFLDITLANGPAAIYLDSRAQGPFCTAEPSCHQAVLPGEYRVIAERSGFERWTGRVTVQANETATLAVTLIEKPSLVTVRVAQPGARVAIDGKVSESPVAIAAGNHRVIVSLAGYAEAELEAVAHDGKPIELDVALVPLVPIRVEPPGATLLLDDRPIEVQGGGIAIPPGGHVLVARAPGYREHRIAIAAERAPDYRLAVQLAPQSAPAAAGAPATSTREAVGVGLIEGGLGAVGLGAVFELHARAESSESTVGKLILATGSAAVVAGVVLLVTAPDGRRPQAVRIVPAVGGDSVGLAFTGRF